MHTLVVVSDAIKKPFFSSGETTYDEDANRDAEVLQLEVKETSRGDGFFFFSYRRRGKE